MTRIVGGAAGGRRIAVPSRGTRPTTDRVREALFNVLTARLDLTGLSVLDLYAGSGALGLEALSRGAASALLVEADPRAAALIRDNVAALGLPGARVLARTVTAVLAAGAVSPVDLVLADPPYDVGAAEIDAVLADLVRHGWVASGTVAVFERAVSSLPVSWPEGWIGWRSRRYGDTLLQLAERC